MVAVSKVGTSLLVIVLISKKVLKELIMNVYFTLHVYNMSILCIKLYNQDLVKQNAELYINNDNVKANKTCKSVYVFQNI